jgi:hypoxia up-regulated 1
MTEVQLKEAKNRMKWYKERDENKIKTDEAKNNFESLVYQFRSWLREEENEEYVVEEKREEWIEKLNEMEDWLYEDGADANFTVYRKKREELNTEFVVYQKRE